MPRSPDDASGQLSDLPSSGPLEQAQQLVYDAWEQRSSTRRCALARKAIKLSPDCADAYLLLAEEAESIADAHELLREAAAAGARALGGELHELAAEGAMWLAIESRPYMRALAELAALEWQIGDRRPSIAHGWDLLRLNPNDNQGIRYLQLVRLLHAGSLEEIERLFAAFPDDAMAAWTFGRALHVFRTRGEGPDSDAALSAAKKSNHHVVPYLLGERALPMDMPDFIGFGDETEAAAYAFDALSLWIDTAGALDWLESRRGPSRTTPSKRRR
jgi:tetratricopeptide (TPR) repeat protein